MAAMKKGTNIGLMDVHLDPIAVGDVIITPGDHYYVITRNGFAQPVDENLHPLAENAVRPSTLEQPKIVKKWEDPKLAEAKPVEEDLYPVEGETAVRPSILEQPKIVLKWEDPKLAEAKPVEEDLYPVEGETAVRPSTLEQPKIVLKWEDPKLAEAKPKKERPFPGIANYDDQNLADELRRRGYKVIATKTTVVKL